jgi:hypothetical protein
MQVLAPHALEQPHREQRMSAELEEVVVHPDLRHAEHLRPKLGERTLVMGVTVDGKSVAYPLSVLQKQSPIIDLVGSTAIVVVLGDDRRSVRAFERTVDGRRLEFFQKTDGGAVQLIDAETGSTWNFEGTATSGPLVGKELKKVFVLEDYWFDWRLYHPDTRIYDLK